MIRDGTEGYLNYSGEGVEGEQLAAPVRMERLAAPVREHLTAPVRIVMMKKLTAPVMEP